MTPPTAKEVAEFGEAFEKGEDWKKTVQSWIDAEYNRQKLQYSLDHDLHYHAGDQLRIAACVLLRVEGYAYDQWPWDPEELGRYMAQPIYEQYIIAAGLLRSDNRRLQHLYEKTDDEAEEDALQQKRFTNSSLISQVLDNVTFMTRAQLIERFADMSHMKQIVGQTEQMLTDRLQQGLGGNPKVLILVYDETNAALEPHVSLPLQMSPHEAGKAFLECMTELKAKFDLDENGNVIWSNPKQQTNN